MLGAPEMDTRLEVGSHKSGVEGGMTSLDLLVMLFLMHPSLRLSFTGKSVRIPLHFYINRYIYTLLPSFSTVAVVTLMFSKSHLYFVMT